MLCRKKCLFFWFIICDKSRSKMIEQFIWLVYTKAPNIYTNETNLFIITKYGKLILTTCLINMHWNVFTSLRQLFLLHQIKKKHSKHDNYFLFYLPTFIVLFGSLSFFLFYWEQQNEKQIVTSKLSKDFLCKYYINLTNTRCFSMYHKAITLCRISLRILNGKRHKLHII